MHNVIYGPQIEPEKRIATHLKTLSGLKHLSRREPLAPRPGEPITLTVTTSGPLSFDEIVCSYTTDLPQTSRLPPAEALQFSTLPLHPIKVEWDQPSWDYVRVWQVQLPGQPEGAILRYQITGRVTGTDCWISADNQASSEKDATHFAVYIGEPAAPAWSQQAMLYHIYLDRFFPGQGRLWNPAESVTDFYGGSLRGVLEKLDYLQALGINTLWLSPLFSSPTAHGYDATDLCMVEPRLGTNQDLSDLITAAHARGIRILLDFVPNHWSNQHPTFLDAQNDPDSPYRDWYLWRNYPEEYEAFFDVKTMPKINLQYGSPARAHLLDVARFWLEQGVDGYRLDHADGPALDFWADFRRVCQQTNPECWLFGEVVKPPSVQCTFYGNLHGQLDFALARALRETFALKNWNLTTFDAFLTAHEAYFPAGFSRPAFLDNHDMNRFLTIAGNDSNRLKLAALVLFTLSAPPILYYGTETGLSQDRFISEGEGFDEARLPMNWDDPDQNLLEYFRTLIHLRHSLQFSAAHRTLIVEPDAGLYAYTSAPETIVAFNTSSEPRILVLPFSLPATVKDHLNGNPVIHHADHLEIHLAPESGAWLMG
ncbi:MAG TPA: alpha-amylase family glycosyl hydrolase [Anaerolineales bacterium]|nr:alpha-amylase family glycosyl hydrolase [Anaerolineales bacterium]